MVDESAFSLCFHGHHLTEENTYFDKTGKQHCRKCVLERVKRYQSKKKGRAA